MSIRYLHRKLCYISVHHQMLSLILYISSLNSREKLRERVLPSENTFVNLTDVRRDGLPMSPQVSAHRRFSRSGNVSRPISAYLDSYVLILPSDPSKTEYQSGNDRGTNNWLLPCTQVSLEFLWTVDPSRSCKKMKRRLAFFFTSICLYKSSDTIFHLVVPRRKSYMSQEALIPQWRSSAHKMPWKVRAQLRSGATSRLLTLMRTA